MMDPRMMDPRLIACLVENFRVGLVTRRPIGQPMTTYLVSGNWPPSRTPFIERALEDLETFEIDTFPFSI